VPLSSFSLLATVETLGGSNTVPAHLRRTRTVVRALLMSFLDFDRALGDEEVIQDSTNLGIAERSALYTSRGAGHV